MPISFAETLELNCPRCGKLFQVEIPLVVDARERPDLVEHILDGTLHDTRCPHCGQAGQVPAPLLFHNDSARRVLFATPPGMPEDEWRAAAEGLLWTLVGSLPENRRETYLGDLQAEAGLEGVAAVIEAENLADVVEAEADETPPIVQAIQALLGASGADELRGVVDRHPMLLEPQAVAILRELAHEAFKQGEDEAGGGFSRAADILSAVRAMQPAEPLRTPSERPAAAAPPAEDPLDELAFALLRSHTGELLAATVDQYPELLDTALDEQLAGWAERARAEGKVRVADGIDERRAALRAMREQYERERPVFDAVQALLQAGTPEELEAVLVEYDALYTDAADTILGRLQDGDEPELSTLVEERRNLLRRIRHVLAQQTTD